MRHQPNETKKQKTAKVLNTGRHFKRKLKQKFQVN